MTKGIYLNAANEKLIEAFAKEKGVSISKAINILIAERLGAKQAPKETKEAISAPTKDKTDKQAQKEDKPLTRAGMFRQMTAKR